MRRLLTLLIAAVILCSCAFGIDYEEESVIRELPTNDEIAEELCEMVQMLTVNSPILPEFDSIAEAMESCRDSVLYYMLTENYGKYTGDIEKLDDAVAAYPQMQITNLIPAREFEETVYTAFGGTRKITNETGRLFIYLDKVAGYTSVTMLDTEPVQVTLNSLSETENTYVARLRCTAGGITSPEYEVIFVKREDGNAYFYSVEEVE